MSRTTPAVFAIVAGLILVVASHALPLWFGGERSMSDDDAVRYTEAHARLHAIAQAGGSPSSDEWQAAQAELDRQRQRLDDSEAQTRAFSWALWMAGALSAVAGTIVYFVTRTHG